MAGDSSRAVYRIQRLVSLAYQFKGSSGHRTIESIHDALPMAKVDEVLGEVRATVVPGGRVKAQSQIYTIELTPL